MTTALSDDAVDLRSTETLMAAEPDDHTPSRVRVPAWLRGTSPALTYFGVGIAMIGFALIAIAWGQIADETQVHLQIPYVVSAGFTGIGLVMVGLTIVNVAAKRRDEHERDRQIGRLVSILEELRTAFAEHAGQPRDGSR